MVFRSFSKLHPNGPVPHQISPPNSRFINPVRAFLAFIYLSKSHAWRGSPFWHREPPLLARASQPKNLPFQPCGRRVSPIQAASFHLQSGDGECLPATQLYLSVFTCPTASLNLPSDAGESTPARQPYLFRPTADLPFRLYLSDTASLDLPSDAGESTPARQPYLFNLLRNEAHPSDTAISKPVGRQREPTGQSNLSFPFCGRQKPTQPRCRLTARLSDHLTLPFCLNPSTRWVPISRRTPARALPVRQPSLFKSTLVDANRPTRWSWNQSDESLPARQSYLFKSHARRGLPVRHGYKQTTVGRQQEPPSQTILPSTSHARRGLPVRLGDY